MNKEAIKRRIGARIKARRMALGLTQSELAEKCGVKKFSVSAWERGANMPAVALNTLAAALECDVDFFTKEGPKPSEFALQLAGTIIETFAEANRMRMNRLEKAVYDGALILAARAIYPEDESDEYIREFEEMRAKLKAACERAKNSQQQKEAPVLSDMESENKTSNFIGG